MSKEEEYKEIFLAEAEESYEQLNNLFTELEKDNSNKKVIDAIFRITHTLKGNAMGLGYEDIAGISHILEDFFIRIKKGNIVIDSEIFDALFKANDKLGQLIYGLKTNTKVTYKGLKTKLEVLLKKVDSTEQGADSQEETKKESTKKETVATEAPVAETAAAVAQEQVHAEVAVEEEEEEEEVAEEELNVTVNDIVQVPVRKLDALLNIVGELIIEKDTLMSMFQNSHGRSSDFARLHRITSDLQYGVIDIRLIQVGFLFNKFNRIVRDVANIEDKRVNLILEGTEIEIDRNVLKVISDSLVHLVRNAVSHGIESKDLRAKSGKNPIGEVRMKARNEKDTVFIEVIDDGSGMDADKLKASAVRKGMITKEHAELLNREDALKLIFMPGFSNAEKVTEVSGRGVGMDAVKKSVESIGGKVYVQTEIGKGSTITLALPSTMALKGALLFELRHQEYAMALSYTEAVISLRKKDLHKVGAGLVSTYLNMPISVVFLNDLFDADDIKSVRQNGGLHRSYEALADDQKVELIVVSTEGKQVGFVVDKLLQQKEIVEKTISKPVNNNPFISGATILGNGNVCLVIDATHIVKTLFSTNVL